MKNGQGKSKSRPAKGARAMKNKKNNLKDGVGKQKETGKNNDKNKEKNKDGDAAKFKTNKNKKVRTSMPSNFISTTPSSVPSLSPSSTTLRPSRSPSVYPTISSNPSSFAICNKGDRRRNEDMYSNILSRVYSNDSNAAELLLDSNSKEHEVMCWLIHEEGSLVDVDDISLHEKFALAFIYTQMGGENWNIDSMWFSNDDPCSWNGIVCLEIEQSVAKVSLRKY